MNQLPELPELQIVETASMRPHEAIEEGRSQRLIRALQTQGFLKNPPVVLRIEGQAERFVVLDGANRTMAVRKMGFPHMLVQIANEGVEVKSWNHILSGGNLRPVLEGVRRISEVEVRKSDEFRAAAALAREESLAYMVLPDGETWQLGVDGGGISKKLKGLTELVSLYEGRFRRERTTTSNLDGLSNLYPEMNCLIVYPQFSVSDVIEVASSGALFPSGLTRFLISPRALRVNFPLAMLADRSPVEEKRRALEEWIRQRVEQRRVRFYAESTFVFDE
ncbi:MAG: hypothetical protein BMS9Abin28_1417 [Anaerolineae bacterium]|nr:MAG: hypothetical protein BMS9Abin28_1417 [Anaerolineae bacterium]